MTLSLSFLRRGVAASIIVSAVALGLSAGSASAATTTLKIGHQTDGLETLLNLSGALKGAKFKISWSNFTSGPPLMEALSANKIDFGIVGNAPVIFSAVNKPGTFKLVAALPAANHKGDALVLPADSTITDAKQLKGKQVAYAPGSSSHAFLIQLLQRSGLTIKDITPVELQPTDGLGALGGKRIDAWAVAEPFPEIAAAILNPKPKVLPTASDYEASGLEWAVASAKATKDTAKVAALKDYLQRLKKALAWGLAHSKEWASAFAKETKLPSTIAGNAAKKLKLSLKPVNKLYLGKEQRLADLLLKAGVVGKSVKINALALNLAGS